MSNVQFVKGVYEAFGRGDIATVLGAMDPAIEWRPAEGHPYMPSGEPWVGPDAVLHQLFMRIGTDWDGFTVDPNAFHDAGDTVVVEVRYTGHGQGHRQGRGHGDPGLPHLARARWSRRQFPAVCRHGETAGRDGRQHDDVSAQVSGLRERLQHSTDASGTGADDAGRENRDGTTQGHHHRRRIVNVQLGDQQRPAAHPGRRRAASISPWSTSTASRCCDLMRAGASSAYDTSHRAAPHEWKVEASTDLHPSICCRAPTTSWSCIEVSGLDCVRLRQRHPGPGYGVDQCIGDTHGPRRAVQGPASRSR